MWQWESPMCQLCLWWSTHTVEITICQYTNYQRPAAIDRDKTVLPLLLTLYFIIHQRIERTPGVDWVAPYDRKCHSIWPFSLQHGIRRLRQLHYILHCLCKVLVGYVLLYGGLGWDGWGGTYILWDVRWHTFYFWDLKNGKKMLTWWWIIEIGVDHFQVKFWDLK